MRGRIEVEIGIKVIDVPPEEVESFLLAFARIAANSDGAVKINPATQKVLQGMPAVQKALQAAPPVLEGVPGIPSETWGKMQEMELERRVENKRILAARREEEKEVRRLEREAAREDRKNEWAAALAEKAKRRAEKNLSDKAEISAILQSSKYCVKTASNKLGITPAGLYMKMQRLGLYTRKSHAERG